MNKARMGGKIKTWQNRMSTYTQLISLFMMFYIFIQNNKWFSWYWWIFIFVFSLSVVLHYDIKHIFGEQQDYAFDKSKRFTGLRKTVNSNSKKLDRILNLLLKEK